MNVHYKDYLRQWRLWLSFLRLKSAKGRNPLLPNYVGHIGRRPVYEADGSLESMDDILILTERDVMEAMAEEWGKLKGYPSSSGTTAKDRWRSIQ
jgi:hypothetical protein